MKAIQFDLFYEAIRGDKLSCRDNTLKHYKNEALRASVPAFNHLGAVLLDLLNKAIIGLCVAVIAITIPVYYSMIGLEWLLLKTVVWYRQSYRKYYKPTPKPNWE